MSFIWFEGNKITLWRDLTKLESRKINVASFKHPAAVRKCVFSKGCKYLATYATDGVLRVFMVSFMDVETAYNAGRDCDDLRVSLLLTVIKCENNLNKFRQNQYVFGSLKVNVQPGKEILPGLT